MSTKVANGKSTSEETRWSEIFTQMQEEKVEFFLNSQLDPTVFLPNDGFQKEWPADSQRVQDLLVSMYFEITNGGILKSTERDFLLAQIREECRRGGRRLTESETQATDRDVVVQAIMALMNEQEQFSARTVDLLVVLRKIWKDGKISAGEEIPIFTNIFARKLNRLLPVLQGYGVGVTLLHKEDGSHCTLTRLNAFQKEPQIEEGRADGSAAGPSGQPSGVNPKVGTTLPPTDGSDGEFRADPPKSSGKEPVSSDIGKIGGAK